MVAFPDGRVVVVDSCAHDGTCLPSALLDWLGCDKPDLLAVTHPDLDHIDGLDTLIAAHRPQRTWRYPGFADLGEWVARWLAKSPDPTGRLGAVRLALEALDELMEANTLSMVSYGQRAWPSHDANPRDVCLAPAAYDLHVAAKPLRELVQFSTTGEVHVHPKVARYLLGELGRLERHGNRLSLALTVHWYDHKLLLGGDVENTADHRTGWRGVLAALADDDRLEEVTDLTLVKAAHHGSNGAWSDELWTYATSGGRVQNTVITRYDRGVNPPPHKRVLERLRSRTKSVALSSVSSRIQGQLDRTGWTKEVGIRVAATAPCVAVAMPSDDPAELYLGGSAGARKVAR